MKFRKTPARSKNTRASAAERREFSTLLRKLRTTNPDGYIAFVRLIREVEKISPK